MGWKRKALRTAVALALWPAVLYAASPPGEEYSRAIGGSVKVKIGSAPVRYIPAAVPKTLNELRRVTGDDFLCVQRDEFLVASDLGPGEYEYLVDGVLDFCRIALIDTFFDAMPNPKKTVNIFIFRDYSSYESGLRRFLGMEPISPYGHYGHTQKYIVVNYETGPGTMVHELTHALMSDDFPAAPIWLAEGMASLYEHCRAEGDTSLRGDDNWRLPELKAALAGEYLPPLTRLFTMSPQTFRTENESLNYAQARYFCKYLEELGLLPTVYKEFRSRPQADATGSLFVTRALGKSIENIDASWRRWIAFQHWKE
jgi:Protein of unknown function (DUF1570).